MQGLACVKGVWLAVPLLLSVALPTIGQLSSGQPNPPAQFPAPSPNSSQQNPKALIDEVWQIVARNYIDTSFNGQNWQAVRQQYLARNYASVEDAYKAIKQMLQLLGDRYTRFMKPEEFRAAKVQSAGEPGNIGLKLHWDKRSNALVVGLAAEESPAFKAGLLPGDLLLSVDGRSTQNMFEYEASGLSTGTLGTPVVLSVKRGQQTLQFTATRSAEPLSPLYSRSQTTAFGNVGYIRLLEFGSNASSAMRTTIQALEKEPVVGYILDLRSNPGGLLYAGIEITRQWLQSGTILSMTQRDRNVEKEQANQRALTSKPLVVIVDEGSAAASEILASALQENQRAVLVGTLTYGQNSVQSVRGLTSDSGLAVTLAKWTTAKGLDISKTGIVPDVRINLTPTQQQDLVRKRSLGTSADPQYKAAIQALSQQVKGSSM
jgi:carboxyl-terminal processing protease